VYCAAVGTQVDLLQILDGMIHGQPAAVVFGKDDILTKLET